jgi:hypothetical protein
MNLLRWPRPDYFRFGDRDLIFGTIIVFLNYAFPMPLLQLADVKLGGISGDSPVEPGEFRESIGRTDLSANRYGQSFHSIDEKIDM